MVEQIVAHAQQLDDQQGGGAALAFVADQFAAVSAMLRRARYDPATGRQLTALLAQLAQTAGFMAYDNGADGPAQRWYLAGLRAAHAAADRPLTASILSLMSNQAATRGNTADALQLAAAAEQAAEHAPGSVRALVFARSGLAYAAAGDLSGFQRTREHATTMLQHAGQDLEPSPRWAYYVSMTELEAIAGRGLVDLAQRVPARKRRLLSEAEGLLRTRALTDDPAYRRSALRHSAWLALAHTHSGDVDQAVTAGQRALDRLPAVSSARSLELLHRLRTDLMTHRHTTPRTWAFTTALQTQLAAGKALAAT